MYISVCVCVYVYTYICIYVYMHMHICLKLYLSMIPPTQRVFPGCFFLARLLGLSHSNSNLSRQGLVEVSPALLSSLSWSFCCRSYRFFVSQNHQIVCPGILTGFMCVCVLCVCVFHSFVFIVFPGGKCIDRFREGDILVFSSDEWHYLTCFGLLRIEPLWICVLLTYSSKDGPPMGRTFSDLERSGRDTCGHLHPQIQMRQKHGQPQTTKHLED